MNDKRLHKLNKTELLWIIRDQEEELEELREYIKALGGDPENAKLYINTNGVKND